MSTLKTYFNNLEKEILRQDPEFMNLLRDMKEDQKRVRAEKNKIREAKTQYIWNYPSFTLTLQYKNKLSSGLYFEEIQLEGIENANMMLSEYRKIGHNLNLHVLTLKCNDSEETRVKKINFKY